MATNPDDFRRKYPSSDETNAAWDAMVNVLDAEERLDRAVHSAGQDHAKIEQRRHELHGSATEARVALAMMRDVPAKLLPQSKHPPGSKHAGSKNHG